MADLKVENIPKREAVLHNLTRICIQLESWAKSSKIVHPMRVKLLRTSIYGYSVLLSGLKDEELELRIMALEEKLKEGILIEHPNEETERLRKARL